MYEKYATGAFVVAVRSVKEADRLVLLYTKEFGMIQALFQGVRNISSKFKGFIDVGNFCTVTLVKGKTSWRATDMSASEPMAVLKENKETFLKTLSLLKALVQGEEKNESLFESLFETFSFLTKRVFAKETLWDVEYLSALRVLKALGYGKGEFLNVSLTGKVQETDLLKVHDQKQKIATSVNEAIRESQLMVEQ